MRVDRPVSVCFDFDQSTPIVQILELPSDYFVLDTEYLFGFINCYFLFFYSFAAIGLHLFTIVMGDAEQVSSGPPTIEVSSVSTGDGRIQRYGQASQGDCSAENH